MQKRHFGLLLIISALLMACGGDETPTASTPADERLLSAVSFEDDTAVSELAEGASGIPPQNNLNDSIKLDSALAVDDVDDVDDVDESENSITRVAIAPPAVANSAPLSTDPDAIRIAFDPMLTSSKNPTCGRPLNDTASAYGAHSVSQAAAIAAMQGRRKHIFDSIDLNRLISFTPGIGFRGGKNGLPFGNLGATGLLAQQILYFDAHGATQGRSARALVNQLVRNVFAAKPREIYGNRGATGLNTSGLFTLTGWTSFYYQYDCYLDDDTKALLHEWFALYDLDARYFSTGNLSIVAAVNGWLLNTLADDLKKSKNFTAPWRRSTKADDRLLSRTKDTYAKGPHEWASMPYGEKNIYWLLPIIKFHRDPATVRMAQVTYDAVLAQYSNVWNNGNLITFSTRNYGYNPSDSISGPKEILWVYLGGHRKPRGMMPESPQTRPGGGSELWATLWNYQPNLTLLSNAAVRQESIDKGEPFETRSIYNNFINHIYIRNHWGIFSLQGNYQQASVFPQNTVPGVQWGGSKSGFIEFGAPHVPLNNFSDVLSWRRGNDKKNRFAYRGINVHGQQWLQKGSTVVWVANRALLRGTNSKLGVGHWNQKMRVNADCTNKRSHDCNGFYRLLIGAEGMVTAVFTSEQPIEVSLEDKVFAVTMDEKGFARMAMEVFEDKDLPGETYDQKWDWVVNKKFNQAKYRNANFKTGTASVVLKDGQSMELPWIQYTDLKGNVLSKRFFVRNEAAPTELDSRFVRWPEQVNRQVPPPSAALQNAGTWKSTAKCEIFIRDLTKLSSPGGAVWAPMYADGLIDKPASKASCQPPNLE
ncbi:MAG: hypothetical protein ACK5NY_05980 [Burkholderiaceae bacterium]